VRDHTPVVIEEFNGLWARGDIDSCPLDHFSDCQNIKYSQGSFLTRDGLGALLSSSFFLGNIKRIYSFNIATSDGFIALNNSFQIYHIIPNVSNTLILTVNGMTDFGMVKINDRAFITPCSDSTLVGLANEFLYVYNGDGTAARKAAGSPPVIADGAFTATNSGTAGSVEAGIHLFSVVYETNSGYLTAPGGIGVISQITAPGAQKVNLTGISVSPNSFVVARHIVATRAIDPTVFTGNQLGYTFYFVPNATIQDNTTTTETVDFFDSDLLDDASHLFDNFSSIAAGGGVNIYHNRLVLWAENNNESLIRVSFPGEPEAISQVDGLLLIDRSQHAISHAQQYRDILYVFKDTLTYAFSDNGDVPSSWPQTLIDSGLGCLKHGVAGVLDPAGINIEYLVIANYAGIYQFGGAFQIPELSWKIKDYWVTNVIESGNIQSVLYNTQVYADPDHRIIYINIAFLSTVLAGFFDVNFDYEKIKWAKWTYNIQPTTICLSSNKFALVIGAFQNGTPPPPI